MLSKFMSAGRFFEIAVAVTKIKKNYIVNILTVRLNPSEQTFKLVIIFSIVK